MVNYAPHEGGKDANREDVIPNGTTHLLQDRSTEIHYHCVTVQPTFGSPSTFITDNSPQRQPGSHYNAHGYRLSPIQGSRKRQRTDNGPEVSEDTDHYHGYRSILLNLPLGDPSVPAGESTDLTYADHVGPSSSHQPSNYDYLQTALPQQHHHHRLPSQALIGITSAGQESEPYQPQIDLSFMDLPGVPTPCPLPKAPKTRFGRKEDEMLITLKEHWKFSWRQIECFFPGRKQQTLQVRYCTKLKEREVVWDDALDEKLKKALEDYEDNKWAHISRKLGPGIPPTACKLRAERLE
ncbi:Homeodomain-like [Penicillium digitatum]|uniref:Homeodomain-like n=1 Tax=Penicillium digitatum TaxID=36651 RepID=A0A7T7BIT6_PENDI|nr:Homeodomain-like [Penicillium digitatum]